MDAPLIFLLLREEEAAHEKRPKGLRGVGLRGLGLRGLGLRGFLHVRKVPKEIPEKREPRTLGQRGHGPPCGQFSLSLSIYIYI